MRTEEMERFFSDKWIFFNKNTQKNECFFFFLFLNIYWGFHLIFFQFFVLNLNVIDISTFRVSGFCFD